MSVSRLYPDGNNLVLVGKFSSDITGRWAWKKGILHSHGGFRIIARSVTLQHTVMSLQKSGEYLSINIDSSPVEFDDLDIEIFDSKLSWLYKLLKGVFMDKIRPVAEVEVEKQMKTTVVQEINEMLKSVPTYYNVYKNLIFDFGMFSEPIVDSTGLRLLVKGTTKTNAMQCFQNNLMVLVNQNDLLPTASSNEKMVRLRVPEQTINCLFSGLYSQGFFSRTIPLPANDSATIINEKDRIEFDFKHSPVVNLRDGGIVSIHADYADVNLWTHIQPSIPFHIHVSVKFEVLFEMHVQENSPTFTLVDFNFGSRFMPTENSYKFKETLGIQQQALSTVQNQIISMIFEALELFKVERGFPIPIVLPWPFDSIQIKDFDLDINKQELLATLNMELRSK